MRDIRHSHDDAGERSIRNIPVHRQTRPADAPEHSHRELSIDGPAELPRRRRSHKGRLWIIAAIVLAVCGVGGLLLSTLFAGAAITIYPRTETTGVPATLQAQPNAPLGVLPYKLITVSRSSSVTVPAQGTQRVSRSASGVITIANTFSPSSQRLIANTRFETADGKIYRIRESVTVPGASGNGSSAKPGLVNVTVYANSPGPEYNKDAGTTFTIPGFKGDPRYETFSAKSADPISGGYVGDEPAIAAADSENAKKTLKEKLDADVRNAAAGEIPEGYVAIPGTLEIAFSTMSQTPGADKTATITQSATASGIVVRQADLASAVAQNQVAGYQGEAVLFGGSSSLDVSLATTTKRADGTITIALKGQAQLIWQFDKNALVSALAGKGKSEFETIIKSFQPAVAKADASVRPFWRGTFPSSLEKITITIDGE